ncbi:hypothetical protein [Pedobacter metabolipauper]|uniref:Phosphatidylcholine 1-acylhydrolase n=1 Tax=Pedobacter metabolipauper TaxID=425513 RepID=A0A4R6T0H3_9SPHI|nr:hypothetical protein [Pedobacter metabolipauper]TDQ10315.1 hypothetical protein ATK78_2481 [Pedobacter metabolipauper]
MRRCCVLIIPFLLVIKIAPAQVNADYLGLYKENKELSYTSPKGEIGAPVKYILNGRLTTSYMLLATDRLPVAFALVPDFTVKVIDEKSAGVRTPSLKIGGVFYVRLNQDASHYRYGTLRFTHHSNGQDNPAINEDGSINTRTGNFSTNYLTATYHFGKRSTIKENSYSLNHDAGLEWHRWFSYEEALENDYGFTRLIYNFSLRRIKDQKENWRLNAGLNYAVNQMSAYDLGAIRKRLNTEASFHYSFPFMQKAFIMAAAGYYGEDPYNIYYRDRYSYLRFGVSSAL